LKTFRAERRFGIEYSGDELGVAWRVTTGIYGFSVFKYGTVSPILELHGYITCELKSLKKSNVICSLQTTSLPHCIKLKT